MLGQNAIPKLVGASVGSVSIIGAAAGVYFYLNRSNKGKSSRHSSIIEGPADVESLIALDEDNRDKDQLLSVSGKEEGLPYRAASKSHRKYKSLPNTLA
jgi:hypothetical protein